MHVYALKTLNWEVQGSYMQTYRRAYVRSQVPNLEAYDAAEASLPDGGPVHTPLYMRFGCGANNANSADSAGSMSSWVHLGVYAYLCMRFYCVAKNATEFTGSMSYWVHLIVCTYTLCKSVRILYVSMYVYIYIVCGSLFYSLYIMCIRHIYLYVRILYTWLFGSSNKHANSADSMSWWRYWWYICTCMHIYAIFL